MKIRQNGQIPCTSALNCPKTCPQLDWGSNKYPLFSSLFVVLIGVFLLPNIVFASPITEEKIINLTNKERRETGVNTLIESNQLTEAANLKGEAILNAQIFDHNIGKKKFSSWVHDTGYKYSYTGENLAIDFISTEGLMRAWIESDAHRKNLLNPNYKEIGVAIIEGSFDGQNTIIVVQIFGTRLKTIVPEEIARKNEQLIPYRGGVLSASSYYSGLKNAYKKPQSNLLVANINFILGIFSVLVISFATYLYFLSTTYLVKILITKKNCN